MDGKTPAGSSMDDSGSDTLRLAPVKVLAHCKAVLRLLTSAANVGAPCPSNAHLARAAGIVSTAAASGYVALLENLGVITVQRGQNRRIVTITATGKRTRGDITAAHVGGSRHAQVAA